MKRRVIKVGLDMWLWAKHYVWENEENKKLREEIKNLLSKYSDLKVKKNSV